MTREEAINILTQIKTLILNDESWLSSTEKPITESFDMAIQALTAISELSKSLKAINRYEMDEKVLIGFNMAVVLFNKHFAEFKAESEEEDSGKTTINHKCNNL